MRRRGKGRKCEPRIIDPSNHPREYVNLTVAAEFLKMDRRALNYFIDQGKIAVEWCGRARKIHVLEVKRFDEWQRQRTARAS